MDQETIDQLIERSMQRIENSKELIEEFRAVMSGFQIANQRCEVNGFVPSQQASTHSKPVLT